jgi:hypothetical protein
VFKRGGWPAAALGWTSAVLVTVLIAWWAIGIAGQRLTSDIALPVATAGGPPPAVLQPPPPTTRPSAKHTGHHTRHNPPPSVGGIPAGSGTHPTPPPTSGSGRHDGGGRPPLSSPPPTTAPPPRPTPSPEPVSDQRTIKTEGGTAAFTCTSRDALSLVYATPASGYTTDSPRVRSASRITVTFRGPVDHEVDARCEGGKVTYSVDD